MILQFEWRKNVLEQLVLSLVPDSGLVHLLPDSPRLQTF